jgi:hypothetical protein
VAIHIATPSVVGSQVENRPNALYRLFSDARIEEVAVQELDTARAEMYFDVVS